MPMMTMLTTISGQKSFGASYIIPANSIILYNGTYSSAIGTWDLYSAANNMLIVGTATQGSIATTQSSSGESNSTIGTIATDGSHFGTGRYIVGGSGNINGYNYVASAGAHTHTNTWDISSSTANSNIKPVHTTFTLLKTSSDTSSFPANTVHIAETNLYSGTQQLASASDRYIVGGNSRADIPATTHSMVYTTANENVSHSHSGGSLTRTTAQVYGSLQSTGQFYDYTTSHQHTLTKTVAINKLKGKLMKVWLSAQSQIPKSSLILMYCGDLSLLPSYWKVCDGNNGTVDMQNYFLGYATSSATTHGATTATNTEYTLNDPTTTSTTGWTHAHFQATSAYYTSMYAYHQLSTINHSHGVSGGTLSSNYEPEHFKLAFIQLIP